MKKNLLIPIFSSLLMFGLGFIVANLYSCTPISGDAYEYCVKCDASPHCGIPLKDVCDMVGEYRDERSRVIELKELFPRNKYPDFSVDEKVEYPYMDSRSVVFDLQTLKNYICKVESIVDKQHKNNLLKTDYSLTGLRFYFTVYPKKLTNPGDESDYMEDIKTIYRNKHSLLIVPTYWDKTKQAQVDFDPRYTDGSNMPLTFASIPTDSTINVLDPLSSCNQANVMNHGGMCPPKCDGAILMQAVDDIFCPITNHFDFDFPPTLTNRLIGGNPCYPPL